MGLLEILTFTLGPVIAKSLLKIWLKDRVIVDDVTLSLVDIVEMKVKNVRTKQRAKRQFEEVGESVAESLISLFEMEKDSLHEDEKIALVRAVAYSLNKVKIDADLIVQEKVDPINLSKHILELSTSITQHYTEKEMSFYYRLLLEVCTRIVDLASQLPSFTGPVFEELIKNDTKILDIARQVLKETIHIHYTIRQSIEQENSRESLFELDYRRAVIRELDVLELFGADVSKASRRHNLSTAYIRLRAEQKPGNIWKSPSLNKGAMDVLPVDVVLARSRRLLITGLPGSGKTTLLQWIAVRAASGNFDGELSSWNEFLPFFIKLRQFSDGRLPRPEEFPALVAPAISGAMPDGWVHKQMRRQIDEKMLSDSSIYNENRNISKGKQVILLLDGLDEVTSKQRTTIHKWVEDLGHHYPNMRMVITSRPLAVDENWVIDNRFNIAEMQPMELSDIDSFIDHWYKTVGNKLKELGSPEDLSVLCEKLKIVVQSDLAIRNLATNPLLCAMVCAMYRDGLQQLPRDRIELYESCVRMLLERRDIERQVELEDYPDLYYRQKIPFLREFAYWLLKNGKTAVTPELMDKGFDNQIEIMWGEIGKYNGTKIRKFLTERSGIIHQVSLEEISFIHRTFQEYFAARAATHKGDIDFLLKNAHDDIWQEVIILASGMANVKEREILINGLISRGDKELKYRHRLYLMAIACFETSLEIKNKTKQLIEKRLSSVVPPKDMIEARTLASVGQLVVPHLRYTTQLDASSAAASIRALGMIADRTAFHVLEGYAEDTRPEVVEELVRAWFYFDRNDYVIKILSRNKIDAITIRSAEHIKALQYLKNLKSLTIANISDNLNLSPLSELVNLSSLSIHDCDLIENLDPLSDLKALSLIELVYTNVADLSPIRKLPLQRIYIHQKVSSFVALPEELTKITRIEYDSELIGPPD